MYNEKETKRNGWSARTVLRYTLWQLPGWAVIGLILMLLDRWFDLPEWTIWVTLSLLIGKDIVMFPFVRTAYEPIPEESAYGLIGAIAIATGRLDPSGHVQVHGELWKAELLQGCAAVEKGGRVVVRKVRGLTLLVQPDSSNG